MYYSTYGFHDVISVKTGDEQHKNRCDKHKAAWGQFVTGARDLLTLWLFLQRSIDDWLGELCLSKALRNRKHKIVKNSTEVLLLYGERRRVVESTGNQVCFRQPSSSSLSLFSRLHVYRYWYGGAGGGGFSQKNWAGGCGSLPKPLTLFMTKICDIPYPIYDLTTNSKPYLWPDP